MGSEHALAIQPLLDLFRVGNRDNLPEALFEASVQNLVTRDGSRRRVVLAAKSEEESDHVLWVAVPLLFHVGLDPRYNGFLPGQTKLTAWGTWSSL